MEGGCIAPGASESTLDLIRLWRNFGIKNEHEIELYGVNGKMDEVRAAFGLATLPLVQEAIDKRKAVVEYYLSYFDSVSSPYVSIRRHFYERSDLELNYAYFPILVDPNGPFNRDELYDAMRARGIWARKYFYPTVSTSRIYAQLVPPGSLPRTEYASQNVLCLPVHHEMTAEDCERVVSVIELLLTTR